MTHTFFLIVPLMAITLTACAEDTPAGGNDPGKTPLPACVEDDFMPLPFGGPGYDPQSGSLIGATQDSYLASSTVLLVNPDKQQRFQELVGGVLATLNTQPGLVGFALGLSPACGTARTLTVWQSEQAMFDFVTSEAHLTAMSEASVVGLNGAVTSWTVTADNVPPSWEEASARVAAAETLY